VSDEQWWAGDPIATGKGGKPITVPGGASAAKPTEDQAKSASFYSRALGSNATIDDIVKTDPDAFAPRGLIRQALHDTAPGIENTLVNSEGRQKADAATREFVAATLRRDSGAAITPAEFEEQYRIYFPTPGEGPEVIAQKAQARQRAIDGLRIGSGPLASDAEKSAASSREPKQPLGEGDIGFGQKQPAGAIQQLSPEDRAALLELAKTGSPEQLRKFMEDRGGKFNNADEVVKARDAGAGVSGDVITDLPKPVDAKDGATGAFMRGLGDTATFGLLDEAGGVVDSLGGTDGRENVWNSRRPLKDILYGNIDMNRAIMAGDEQNHFPSRTLGQLAGAVAIPVGAGARGAAEVAKVGGGVGAAYGFGSGQGGIVDRLPSAVGGGVTGAALGYGVGKVGELVGARWPRKGPPDGAPPADGGPFTPGDGGIQGAAERLGITPTPATTGGNMAAGAQRVLGNLPGSSGPVRNAVDAETAALGDTARKTASRMGPISTPQGAGEAVASSAADWSKATAAEGSRMYAARDALMGGEAAPVVMGNTAKNFATLAQDFPSSPIMAQLMEHPSIRKLAAAMPDNNELTVGEATDILSHMRTVLRNAHKNNSVTPAIERRIGQVEQSIEDDIMNAAQASDAIAGRSGPGSAVNAQKEADSFWRDRSIAKQGELKLALKSASDDVNASGESVYRQIFNDMKETGGNVVRLRKTLGRLSDDARKTFAASAFDDFGRATKSAQNANGDAWSFQTFMSNWSDASDEAKRLAFGGRGVDREISDIVQYAERLRQIDKTRNFSNTSPNAMAGGTAISALTALMTGNFKTATGIAASYPALNGIGRAFVAVPALRSWARSALKASIKANDAQMGTLTRRLTGLAAGNPAVQGEVKALQQYLMSAANDNASRVAASGPNEKNQPER